MIDYEFMDEVSSNIEKAKKEKEAAEAIKREVKKEWLQAGLFIIVFLGLIILTGIVEGM